MKKRVKQISLYIISIALIAVVVTMSVYLIIYFSNGTVNYDSDKIFASNLNIEFFDKDNRLMKQDNNFNTSHIKLNTLPNHISECFISIEDKEFYNHNGLNYKRIAKAFLTNLKSFRIKEGASTISQQLVKNTHLSNERSFKRKFNEILITKKMENNISKEQILEAYLNVIYFGNGCYGIENASNYYFSKSAKNLTVPESALLAGMIKSPYNYSPIFNEENCFKRRNLVLRALYKDKKISYEELNAFSIQPIKLNLNKKSVNKVNTYSEAALDEAIKILKMPAKQIAIAGYKIYTYQNTDKQTAMEDAILENNPQCDYCSVSINTDTAGIEAYVANSPYKVKDNPRQPGSALKPIVAYAPALEENHISPLTQINDEPINISGYSPKNISNKFYGYISVNDCVAKSLNIPAIKCLSYVGIDKGKYYATKCGITFDDKDTGYSIALGGLTKGVNAIELANSYIPLACKGAYRDAKFISYITDNNGKIVYVNNPISERVYREDTAYLMTDMLVNATKVGTSKLLHDCEYMVASKTGTVGIKDNSQNLDAWNVSYTTKDINVTWLGNMDNSPISYVGGNMPVKISKTYFNEIYKQEKPQNFEIPSSIEEIDIDAIEYEDHHKVVKANEYTPERYKIKAKFSKFNLPKHQSNNFISVTPANLSGKIEGGNAVINFEANDYMIYEVYKTINNKTTLLQIISKQEGNVKISDKIEKNSIVSYYVIAKIKNFTSNIEIASEKSNTIELINTTNGSVINNDKKNGKKWYI